MNDSFAREVKNLCGQMFRGKRQKPDAEALLDQIIAFLAEDRGADRKAQLRITPLKFAG